MNYKIIKYVQIAAGMIFLLSGLAKAFDADHFGNILAAYGFGQFYFAAPVIVFAELMVGLALIFDIVPRYTAFAGLMMIAVFTGAYSYGLIFADIRDCGCFGRITFLNSSPTGLYIRNSILAAALFFIARQRCAGNALPLIATASLCLAFTGGFICGNTFSRVSVRFGSDKIFAPIALAQHPLQKFIKTDRDSTYMVTVFSYTCPHCINSIGNIEQYERFGVVDAVIGLCVENTDAEAVFREKFQPKFRILNYPMDELSKLSYEFPISYIIRNDSITGMIPGEVPSAYFIPSLK